MKVLLANTVLRRGGAAQAMHRVAEALRSKGIEVGLLSLGHEDTTGNPPDARDAGRHIVTEQIIDRMPLLLYRNRWSNFRALSFSAATRKWDSSDAINAFGADVVNLHWVNYGYVSPEGLARIKAPVVWTAHDMWPFTGGCHHSDACQRYRVSCGICPVLGSKSPTDWSHRLWERKNTSWAAKKLRLVCPSNWLAEQARCSSLFRERPITVIPNPLDLKKYSPGNQFEARKRFGLPLQTPLILFGSSKGLRNKQKGFQYLDTALQILTGNGSDAAKPHLVILGSTTEDAHQVRADIPAHFLGSLGQSEIVEAYRAADVFVLPSLHENLPNMIAEAMACGTPAVAFNVGGIVDLIDHRHNGFLARAFEPADLATGIAYCLALSRSGPQIHDAARQKIGNMLSPDRIANAYVSEFGAALREERARKESSNSIVT